MFNNFIFWNITILLQFSAFLLKQMLFNVIMKTKIFAVTITILSFVFLYSQFAVVLAKKDSGQAPITSSGCRFGFGYGDKNHCHSGAPGQIGKD